MRIVLVLLVSLQTGCATTELKQINSRVESTGLNTLPFPITVGYTWWF